MSSKKKGKPSSDAAATNPNARRNYEIIEKFEAGMVLTGSEVKSLRQGRASLREAYAVVRDGEIFLQGMHIPQYAQAGYSQHEPTRPRKLLLKKEEIRRLSAKTAEKGLTLVPLKCYFSHGLAKLELGLGRGKKLFDKRQDLKTRDHRRQVDRAIAEDRRK